MFYEPWHKTDADYFDVQEGENFSYPLHLHRCYEVVLVTDGEMTVSVDGRDEHLTRGQAVLIFPNQVHALTSSHSRHKLVIFAPELVAAYDRKVQNKLPRSGKLELADTGLLPLLTYLHKNDSLVTAKSVLYGVCAAAEVRICLTEATTRTGNAPLLREIFGFIQAHYREDCSLAVLAHALQYDMTYLSKFFSDRVGLSYTAYVNQVRIAHACYLLRNTEDTVLAISHACGIDSLRTFNRNFLAVTGQTPREYRQ